MAVPTSTRRRGWVWDRDNTYLVVQVDGTEAAHFDDSAPYVTVANGFTLTAGNLAVTAGSILSASATSGVGYSTGAGGAVTQQTNKTTGVTLNQITGTITMNGAALAAAAQVVFTVTNSAVAATDVPVVCVKSGATTDDDYVVGVGAVAAGGFDIYVGNVSAGSLSDTLVLSFVVIKGVAA